MRQHKKLGKERSYAAAQEVTRHIQKLLVNTTQPIRREGTASKQMILLLPYKSLVKQKNVSLTTGRIPKYQSADY